MVEQLMTVWNGICVKIKFEYFSLDLSPSFYLSFSKSLSLDEVPMPEIYLTSEDNAYGIINYGWANGEELKIDLEGVEQVIFWDIKLGCNCDSRFTTSANSKKISNRNIFPGYQTICISSKKNQLYFNM